MESLKRQFLEWIDMAPRTYEEAIEAWQTHCARFSIWEDALSEGLIEIRRGESKGAAVRLTPKGRSALGGR